MPDGDDTATATATETTTDSTGNNSNSGNAGDSGITNNDSGPDTSGGNSSTSTDPSITNAGGGSTDEDGLRLLDSGSWNGAVTKNFQGGQGMHFKLKNVNVLGTTITLNSNLGGSKSLIILPQQTSDMKFSCFGTRTYVMDFRCVHR